MIQTYAGLVMITATAVVGFLPVTTTRVDVRVAPSTSLLYTTAKDQQLAHLDELAHKLRLRVFDLETGKLIACHMGTIFKLDIVLWRSEAMFLILVLCRGIWARIEGSSLRHSKYSHSRCHGSR